VRLFLFESGVIAALGGAGGVLLAAWVVRGFRALPGFAIPRAASVSVDPVVLLFAFALAAATAIVFGLAPALQVTRVHLMSGLRQAGAAAGAPAGGRRLRGLLVGVEVALSLMLLAGAGLMVRTLANLASVDLGFRPEGVMTLSTQQPGSRYGEIELRRRFAAQALERIGSRPGVASAALAWPMDLVGFSWSPYARFRDRPAPSGREPAVQLAVVSPSYFETMGIPLKRGRVFGPGDRAGAPVVAIVNETVVRNLLPAGDPVGRRLSIVGIPELADLEIVGVAGDTLRRGPAARAFFEVYCAYEQFPASNPVMIVRAAAGDPLPLVRSVQDGLASVDPTVATYNPRRLEDVMAARVGDRRLLTRLLGLFAGLALLLTAAGIGSVVSFVVAQRTQELGVRMALGADGGALIRMVLRGAMIPVAAGLAAGLAASVPLAPTVQRYLFQVTPADPIALAGGALVLVATAMLAAYVPARRATRIDPVVALRQT
jgi:putative ABC transport system permease protein